MRHLAILGSTGSIGGSTLDVVRRHPDRFRVVALAARSNAEELARQCLEFAPRVAVLADAARGDWLLRELAGQPIEVRSGADALCAIASAAEVDTVMAAIVGAAGLDASLAAAAAGKRLLLANKEALVMAGRIFMDAVHSGGGELLPIDSEHNAIFQCLPPRRASFAELGVRRLILTASGGPFRDIPPQGLHDVTPEQACAHPIWVMGRKISVDSATLMNKGLEVIEAHFLFGAAAEQIDVVIHPQSVIHSLVEYADGSVLAQLGNPDMRTPITNALAYPERIEAGVARLDLPHIGNLNFAEPNPEQFPCLRLAYQALRTGGAAPAVLNAANEVAVEAFFERRLRFTAIAEVVSHALERLAGLPATSLAEVLHADAAARRAAAELVARL
jgi:1-deoxy-D-xylulose-5-phosphate reductoisomerase